MAGQSIVESTIRRRAQKAGYIVNKSRWRKHNLDNYGDYALLDARTRSSFWRALGRHTGRD
jgi:hypothetical protein